MYFTSGSDRAFEQLMQTRPGADHFDSGEAGAPEDCGTCRFYRPHWKYQFCVYEECPYQPGKLTALDGAVKFQVKGVDDEMAVFRVEKNRGYTVMSNHHLRNKDLSLKAKGLLSQMLADRYDKEQAELTEKIEQYEREGRAEHDQLDKIQDFIDEVSKYAGITELNYKILHQLIDKILVSKAEKVDGEYVQKIQIFYRFIGPLDAIE